MSLGEFCLSPQFSACVSVANLVFIIFEEKVWNRFWRLKWHLWAPPSKFMCKDRMFPYEEQRFRPVFIQPSVVAVTLLATLNTMFSFTTSGFIENVLSVTKNALPKRALWIIWPMFTMKRSIATCVIFK